MILGNVVLKMSRALRAAKDQQVRLGGFRRLKREELRAHRNAGDLGVAKPSGTPRES